MHKVLAYFFGLITSRCFPKVETERCYAPALIVGLIIFGVTLAQSGHIAVFIDQHLGSSRVRVASLTIKPYSVYKSNLLQLGGLKVPQDAFVHFSARFHPRGLSEVSDLFQTAPLNLGVRLELSGSHLVLVVKDDQIKPKNIRGIILADRLDLDVWHSLDLEIKNGSYIRAVLDGYDVVSYESHLLDLSFSEMALGRGFDETRNFKGDIELVFFEKGNCFNPLSSWGAAFVTVILIFSGLISLIFICQLFPSFSRLRALQNRSYVICGFLLGVVLLYVWSSEPLYPDEFAMRYAVGHYSSASGSVHKLFHLCETNERRVPVVLVPAAIALSFLEQHISLVDFRRLHFLFLLAGGLTVNYLLIKAKNLRTGLILFAALVGVAGAGLTLARFESVLWVNILGCLLSYAYVEGKCRRCWLDYIAFFMLAFSLLASVYGHIQGALFIPLSGYLSFKLLRPNRYPYLLGFLLFVGMFYLAFQTWQFHALACRDQPKIFDFLSGMAFDRSKFVSMPFWGWLSSGFQQYTASFLYQLEYPVHYLPGVNVSDWQDSIVPVRLVNRGITFILYTLLMLNGLFGVMAVISLILLFIQYPLRARLPSKRIGLSAHNAICLALFVWPALFLFFYDDEKNFYRTAYLNLIFATSAAVVLARLNLKWFRAFFQIFGGLCLLIALYSGVVNFGHFGHFFRLGLAGPSISLNQDFERIDRQVDSLAKLAAINLSEGGIVYDDLTYSSVKQYPNLYPLSYLRLSGELLGYSCEELLTKVHPNAVIARCSSLSGCEITGWPQIGNFCALKVK